MKVISYLLDDESYSVEDISKKIDVKKRTIDKALSALQNKGLIERIVWERDGVCLIIK
ncbi:MAG: helix-turn-helix domain-containing protein [Pleomorphochaeta sp.]